MCNLHDLFKLCEHFAIIHSKNNIFSLLYQRDHPAHKYGDHVWLSCDGEYNADKESIGPIQYIPANQVPGFPTRLLHTADRISRVARNIPDQEPGPLIAVYFERPRSKLIELTSLW